MPRTTEARTLAEVIVGADVFLGLSAAGVLKPEMLRGMAREAADHGARQSRAGDHAGSGAGGAAGCDDLHRPLRLPNQVNNVLCFPYIFRGALDVGATDINEEMKIAAVRRHRGAGARAEPSDIVARAPMAARRRRSGRTT